MLCDKECGRVLDALKEKENGLVLHAAAKLTPFVKALYNGEDYSATLRVELVDDFPSGTIGSQRILELCEEVDNVEATTIEPSAASP